MKILTRLRATKNGLVDLVSTNKWQQKGSLTFEDGKFNQYGIHLQNGYIFCTNLPDNILNADDCTISFWVKAKKDIIFALSPNNTIGSHFYFHNTYYGVNPTGSYWLNMNSDTIPQLNVWNHCAFTRKDGIGYLFLNGKLLKSVGYDASIITQNTIYTHADGWDDIQDAVFDDIVIIKDKALWTEDFAPPSDYLVVGSKMAFIDNNKNLWGVAKK